ncbi:MAG: class I SAM-dependent methyltransferase [Negativicutes bacterium]|nr:class I SAM-dependent methyltransferase [Negativicutes bacterium]MDR3591939.1 class I SAM-dependent methyltransferase [Negativicutes bacterium]
MSREQEYFDRLATDWDDLRVADPEKIRRLMSRTGLRPGDRVLDAGCGTGILVPYIRKAVGGAGQITAVDFSASMIALAAAKYKDEPGVRFLTADIMDFQPDTGFDAIICFNFFPHVADKPAFLARMRGMLAAGGGLVIMHDISRDSVNGVHAGADAVKDDRLPPGEGTAGMLAAAGFRVGEVVDNDELYFVKGCKS